jgi:hypothetical protein
MRIYDWSFALALLLVPAAHAAPPYSEMFSSAFKASIDRAMREPGSHGRTSLLIKALRQGSDNEVFYVFPLLFPSRVIKGAQRAHVCVAEITASLANIKAYMASSSADRKEFPKVHAKGIRTDTENLIKCLDQYYADGQLHLPPA